MSGRVPAFITDERLKLCWGQIAQIRELVPQGYLRLSKDDSHEFDEHPLQYAVPLFTFALRLACFYREPNPISRQLAAFMVEKLAASIALWVDGGQPSLPAGACCDTSGEESSLVRRTAGHRATKGPTSQTQL